MVNVHTSIFFAPSFLSYKRKQLSPRFPVPIASNAYHVKQLRFKSNFQFLVFCPELLVNLLKKKTVVLHGFGCNVEEANRFSSNCRHRNFASCRLLETDADLGDKLITLELLMVVVKTDFL